MQESKHCYTNYFTKPSAWMELGHTVHTNLRLILILSVQYSRERTLCDFIKQTCNIGLFSDNYRPSLVVFFSPKVDIMMGTTTLYILISVWTLPFIQGHCMRNPKLWCQFPQGISQSIWIESIATTCCLLKLLLNLFSQVLFKRENSSYWSL